MIRAERSDKGQVRLTQRDLEALTWLSDMKAIAEPDLGVLLGRLAGSDSAVSASAVRRMIVRWQRAGLAIGRKLMVDQPRIVFLQQAGAQLVGETTWRETAVWTALHQADVSRARLWLEGQAVEVPGLPRFTVADWHSERRWRQELGARHGGKVPVGTHVPDGVVTTPKGKRIAVEVERTPKERRRLDSIMAALLVPGGYDAVLYLTTAPVIENGVRAAYERARERGYTVPLGLVPMPGALT